MKHPFWFILGCLLLANVARGEEPLSFNRDVRPILSDACFACHGPDAAQLQAGLRLDVRELALQPADSGTAALVPGKPDDSELLRRITHADADQRMPPADSGKRLSPAQIDVLRRWIAQGAEYEGHWAFVPPVRPAVPEIPATPAAEPFAHWRQNPIDRFVLARLLREGLTPAPEADKTTLLRRVSLDLIGLPPTPEEIDAFLADDSPQAYEKAVDRLLMSPHYGERMALPWLDYARYADSNGYQTDGSRFQWPWRDWVIDAFNRNLPFDQFTVEQLAGDLLPDPAPSQIVATGFNRNHRLNGEGGIIAEEWRVETVIDRVETTGQTWLGLTLGCCRCHDHKFDPVTQKEFYQLFAFFNNITESGTLQGDGKNTDPVMQVVTAENRAEVERLEREVQEAQARAAEAARQLPQLVAAWEPDFRKQIESSRLAWIGLAPSEVKSSGGAAFTRQEDGTYLASGPNPAHDVYEITAPAAAGSFSGLLLECFPDPSLPNQSLGRYPNGNFVLTRVEAEIAAPGLEAPLKAKFARAEADYSQNGWDIAFVNSGNPAKGWAIDGPTRREPRRAMFVVETPLTVPADATLTVRLHHEAIGGHNIGRFRLAMTSLPPGAVALEGSRLPDLVQQALGVAVEKRTPEQKAALEKFYREQVDGPVRQADAAAAAAAQRLDEYRKNLPTVMVMREGPPRKAYFLKRGQYDLPGEEVQPGLPAALPPLPAGAPLNRLGLAQWIVDPSNPLTARVWVNRTWARFFGVGLVKTTEDFGSQGEYPSHPELLDWLACEFMAPSASPPVAGAAAQPWDMKALQKLIVLSAAYRQASRVTPELLQRDPDNRLLARGARVRLPGELIRDQALAASGLLVKTIGGPSVRPYMPQGVWDETSRYGDLRNYRHDTGDGLHRRTMYTIWKRTAAPPTLLLFDAPNREVCVVKRSRTNTPLQALALLNEITFVEAARKLGERMLAEGGATVDERLTHGFRLTLARRPTATELRVLREGLNADLARFRQDPDAAKKLLSYGEAPSVAAHDPAELAAYALAANVLLNLDELVTRE